MFKVKGNECDDQTLPANVENRRSPNVQKRELNFVNLQTFVFVSGLLMCAQSSLSMYTKSVLTSIERRFQISSSLAGLIVGSFNFGNMLFVVLVSKLSTDSHRPRIMAFGSLVIALGGFLNVIPHVTSPNYDPYHDISMVLELSTRNQSLDVPDGGEISTCTGSTIYILLIMGEMLQGIGATVLVPLGASYVDDFAQTGKSPLYLGIMFLLQNLGPGVGYLVGSSTTRLYVDFNKVGEDKVPIKLNDPSWVGAWWLGYIIIGVCVILTAVPLFWFPRNMEKTVTFGKKTIHGMKIRSNTSNCSDVYCSKRQKNVDDDCVIPLNGTFKKKISNNIETSYLQSPADGTKSGRFATIFRDLYFTVKRLLTNPVYLMVVMGYSGLMFVVGALTAFMPKYLEVVFYQSKSQASLIFGLSMPIVICIGLFSGGFIVQRSKLEARGTLRFIVCVVGATIFLCVPAYYIKCDPQPDILCSNVTGSYSQNSSHCADQLSEICKHRCYAFVAVMSLAALVCCHIVTPSYSAILRTVNPRDKCTAIGLKFLIMRLIAFIPSPIITGAAIDDVCVQWSVSPRCVGTATCLQHDRKAFRHSYLHIIVFGVVFTFLFNLAGCLLHHRREKQTSQSISKNGIV